MSADLAELRPGTRVLVDTDRTCRRQPMRGVQAVIHDTWHDQHNHRDYVIVCLEGHQQPSDCVWKCRMPLLRTDEVIRVPDDATDAGYLTTAVALLACIALCLLFLALLGAGRSAMCSTHHGQDRPSYCEPETR